MEAARTASAPASALGRFGDAAVGLVRLVRLVELQHVAIALFLFVSAVVLATFFLWGERIDAWTQKVVEKATFFPANAGPRASSRAAPVGPASVEGEVRGRVCFDKGASPFPAPPPFSP